MRRAFFILPFLGSLLNSAPEPIVRPEWGTGPSIILKEISLPSSPDKDTKKFGYIYRGRSEGSVFDGGWNKTHAEGSLPFWFDDNRNREREGGETQPVKYRIDYHVNNASVEFSESSSDQDGARLAKKYLEEVRQRQPGLRLTGIGDSGLSGFENNNKSSFIAYAVRGPLRVNVNLSCVLAVAEDLRRYEGQIVRYTRNSSLESVKEMMSRSFTDNSSDSSNPKLSHYSSWAYEGGDAVLGAYKAAFDAGPAEAAKLAMEICGAWDAWANRHPQSSAPGIKGLYMPDMSPYWPRPEEMPKDIVLEDGARLPDNAGPAAGLSYRSADKKQRYSIWLKCHPYEARHLYADAPVQLANAQVRDLLRSEYLQNQEYKPVNRSIDFYGADEAQQVIHSYSNMIVFRCANVVVTVKANGELKEPEKYRTEEIARLVLDKLLNKREALPRPVQTGLILSEHEPWARILLDGKTEKVLVARCIAPDGSPAPNVRVAVSADDSQLPGSGRIVRGSAVTDARGEARFSYIAPSVPADHKLDQARVVFHASCALGSPAQPFGDRLTVPLEEGTEVPLEVDFSGAQVLNTDVCNKWVYGKPSLMRAEVKWKGPNSPNIVQADLRFSFDGQEVGFCAHTFKDFYGDKEKRTFANFAYAVFTPQGGPKRPKLTVEVFPRALSSKDGHRYFARPFSKELEVEIVEPNATIRFHFTAIKIGSWSNLDRLDDQVSKALRDNALGFLRAILPLPPHRIMDETSSNVTLFYDDKEWVNETGWMLKRLKDLHDLRTGSGIYDYEVGFAPEDWLADYGLQSHTHPNAILLQVMASNTMYRNTALAHEVGHFILREKMVAYRNNEHTPSYDESTAPGACLIQGQGPNPLLFERPAHQMRDFMRQDILDVTEMGINKSNYEALLKLLTK